MHTSTINLQLQFRLYMQYSATRISLNRWMLPVIFQLEGGTFVLYNPTINNKVMAQKRICLVTLTLKEWPEFCQRHVVLLWRSIVPNNI